MAVLNDLRAWLGPYDVWFTGGEAFARRDITELFSHATRIGMSARVISRGVGVYDEQTARRVINSGLDEYHVSIEALKPEMHDYVSPPKGSFAKATGGIDWLNRLRRNEKSRLRIIIKTIIMGFNCDEILGIVEWVRNNGFDEIKFQPLEQTIEEEKDVNWFTRNDLWPGDEQSLARVVDVMEELIKLKRDGAPIHNSERELAAMKSYFLDPVGMYEPVKSHVLPTIGRRRVTNDGWLEIWHNGEARTSWRNPPFGNVVERPIWELWRERASAA
jgi:MoaA/NifB/PqqE/SkfB family radical SAM enzyme